MTRCGPVRGAGRKTIAIACALLCLAASVAPAGGLDFNWSTSKQCPTVPTHDWTFGCDTNDAVMYMVVAFQPNVVISGFQYLEGRIDVQSWGSIPAWWQAYNAGSCRESAFVPGVIDVDPTEPCTARLWYTQAYGGLAAWLYDTSNRIRIVFGFATAEPRSAVLSKNYRYNGCHIAVRTTNTVYVAPDPDHGIEEVIACDGCCQGMILTLTQVGVYGGGGSEDYLSMPIYDPGGGVNGTEIAYQYGAPTGVCNVPVRKTTWGQLKGMYR